jgi:chaperonin GroEL
MSKIVKFTTKGLQKGTKTVVKAVTTSYGPVGRTSVLQSSYGAPNITNDGVTIAKAIELEGEEQLGVSLIQEAANKTNEEAGDGTSSTTIIAGKLIDEGIRVVEAGSDPIKVRNGIAKATEFSINFLSQNAKQISTQEEKANVATISSRDEEIGQMIAKMLEKVGKDGVVTVQTGDTNKIEEELTEGMQFDKGYKSPYFVTDSSRMEAVVDKPYILVTDQKISNIQDVLGVIEALAQAGKKDLVLIADDIEGEALASFVVNKIRGIFNVYAVQAPAFGDRRKAILEDIAVLTGATFMSGDLGMNTKKATVEDLGSAEKVIISKDNTTIIGGKGDKEVIEKRSQAIKQDIINSESDYDREKLEERLAKLVGGVGVIKVGAATEVEMKKLKYEVEDALNATKAAIAEGVVIGGAAILIKTAQELDKLTSADPEEQVGINIFKKALEAPFRAMSQNSGIYDIAILVNDIKNSKNGGFDFKNNVKVEDMFEAGIIDPVMVLKKAIQNASSVAKSVITTEVIVVDKPKKEDDANLANSMGGMGGMGGMGMM